MAQQVTVPCTQCTPQLAAYLLQPPGHVKTGACGDVLAGRGGGGGGGCCYCKRIRT